MPLALDPRYYAHVPVYLWPVLFLRLWALHDWCAGAGRKILFTVTSSGAVIVRAVEDDPQDLAAWCARQRHEGRRHLACLANADGTLGVHPIVTLAGQVLARFGCDLRHICAQPALRRAPDICDTS